MISVSCDPQEQLSREQEESRRGWHQELQERRASLSERARHSREEQARQRAEVEAASGHTAILLLESCGGMSTLSSLAQRNRVNVATEKERFERRKREVEALERYAVCEGHASCSAVQQPPPPPPREEGEGRRASAAELASRVEERQRRMKEEKEADRKAAT